MPGAAREGEGTRELAGFGSGSGTHLLAAALEQFMRDAGASGCLVYLLSPGERVLRLAVLAGVPRQVAAHWTQVPLAARTPATDAVRERRLVWIGGQEEMARHYPQMALALPYPFSAAAAPITTGTTVWGALVVRWPSSHPSPLTRHERNAIHTSCRRLGLLLRQAADSGHPLLPGSEPQVLAPLRARARGPAKGAVAADFAERLPGGCLTLDLDGRITFITTTAADLLGASAVDLLGVLPRQVLPWLDDPVVEGRYRAAVLSHEATSFTVLRPPDRWLSFHLYPDISGISVRIAPASPSPASETSEVLHPVPPGAPGRSTAHHLLMHLAATLTEAVGVMDVIARIDDLVPTAFEAQALALMIAEEGRLRIIGYRGYTAELMDRFDGAPLASETPAVGVLNSGVPSFYATFADLKRAYPPAVLQDDMAAWAFLPLIASGRPVGSLVLAYDRPHPFTPEERAVLTATAGLIAQALDRARLYDANQALSHSLQASLLPHALPRVPGLDVATRYLPTAHGMDVGGDFYDLIHLDTDLVAATIGDVQGHNVNAAALMGQVRTAVHATAGASPGQVLARTNRLLTDLDPGLFTSCLYVQLDLARHRVCLATAGHPPPLLRHPDLHTEILPLIPGLLLGIDPDAEYPETNIPLPPGAVLALYTDGLVETPGIDIDDATADLADQLAQARDQTLDALADTLIHHAQRSAPRNDDIALLLIQPQPHGC
ncbi:MULTISPECIES: SpoIIE family protein phosphatase [unclassified Streptomyces]|uniref:SpoIIE family protein phosphatase n=1 Tax=unclassified Streptomyces TaxID=2593676 RepID=UPI002DD7A917|nr:SpoIIE family protein phosphatase [Streptomyces sp. NBC_01760]